MPRARRFGDQLVGVGERAERGIDVDSSRRRRSPSRALGDTRDRIEPDAVDAEPLQIVEPLDDAAQVADPVAVRVHVGTGIDLVQDAVAPPRPAGLVGRHVAAWAHGNG